ncbi:lipoprotein 17-related variable surface protein [Metamycoplasma hyosynoviae]|uniref:lipoprotein 17-related variable surface protein n=2 Tax=Metamycoplasma hyosynoviae TaxID=29559 RepID=UPI002358CBB5|nr:lipoprotein 17-related variable surface protein [Metamycoplasma hyosynoviae]MDC8937916.1 lipoprotein 17-related variable surface protein [Metamycoplasma hyosynoviae]
MSKQSKIILLSSLITPPTCIPLLVISCTNQDPTSEIEKVKVSIVTLDKLASEITDSDIKITGYRTSVFSATQTHQVNTADPTTLEVLVELKNIKKGTKAQKVFPIKGFKVDPTEEIKSLLATELEKISGVAVDNHTDKIANTIVANEIKITETSAINKNTFELSINPKVDSKDKTKLNVTIRLKHKQSGILSKAKNFSIEGFKPLTAEQEELIKKLNTASRKVTVDVDNKANIFAKEVTEVDLKFTIPTISGIIDDPNKYEIIEKSWSVSKTDSKNLEVYFQLKNKENNFVSDKRKFEIKGFKEAEASTPEEKALGEALNAISLSYEGGKEVLDKTDAGDLEITKVKLENQREGFEYSHKFKNDNPSKVNYDNGFRTVVITVKKGSKSLSKEINLECFKSDYDVIIKQRKEVKNIDLLQTPDAKTAVEALFTGGQTEAEIFYDFKDQKFYDKKYDNTDKKQILNIKSVSWAFGTTFGKSKLIKLSNGKYKALVTLGKNYKEENNTWKRIYDTKQSETNELSFEIIDQNAVDKLAEDNKDNFDYPEKTTINVDNTERDKVKLPVAKLQNIPASFIITDFTQDAENAQLIIKYKVEIENNGIKYTSKIVETKITGFKQEELAKEFTGMTVQYEGKESIQADQVEENKFKLAKDNVSYGPPVGIQQKIDILSKDKYNGIVKIKVTLTKGTDTVSKEFDVNGFKKVNLDFNNIAENSFDLTFEGIEKQNVFPSTVVESNVKVNIKDEYKTAIQVVKITLTPNNKEGKLTVKVTLKDLTTSTPDKEITKEESGFKKEETITKKYKLQELYNESVSKSLIAINSALKEEIIKLFNSNKIKDYGDNKKLLVIKNGIFYTKNNKGEEIKGLSIRNSNISNQVNTHGGAKANIAKPEKIGNSAKGILLHKDGNKWIAKWVLILDDDSEDTEIFEQVLLEE